MWLWAVVGFGVGVLINLIADFWPSGLPLQVPRCANCQRVRAPLQWSGLLAYLSGRSRCHACGARIHWRWPLVELAALVLFAFLFYLFDYSLRLVIISFYTAVLLLVTVIDFEHRLILNRVMYPAIAAALLLSFATPRFTPLAALAGGLTGLILTALIYIGGLLFVRAQARRGRTISEVAFGQGDVTLMLFVGAITGLTGAIRALVLGVMIGGVVALLILVVGLLRRQSALYIPFAYGPYLALAGWLVLLQNAVGSVP